MRVPRAIGAVTVGLVLIQTFVALPGAPAATAANAALAAAASPGATLFVDSRAASCPGNGTPAQPFCTISAAAAAVQPGQTVMVEAGGYDENVTITRSGTATAPIRFIGVGYVRVGGGGSTAVSGTAITVSGAHYVTLERLTAVSGTNGGGIMVTNSSHITIERGTATAQGDYPSEPALQISGSSNAVTVSKEALLSVWAPAVQLGAGVSASVIVDDSIRAVKVGVSGVVATDAPDTTITSDTVVTYCGPAIELDGTSTGASVENNILQTTEGLVGQACATPADATALTVSPGSVPQTTADYNLIAPASGGPLYSWAGTTYTTPSAFTAATGQGSHDLAKNPDLSLAGANYADWFLLSAGSPAIDSANANAPNEPFTDFFGRPRADDPNIANTGTPSVTGYFDRGAVELNDGSPPNGVISLKNTPAVGPLTVAATLSVPAESSQWPTNGPARFDLEYSFQGQGWSTPEMLAIGLTSGQAVTYTLPRAGYYTMSYMLSTDDYRTAAVSAATDEVVVGAGYTALPPSRLLDTRNGTGAAAAPVPAGGEVVLPITGTGNVPPGDLSAVVANVTVTKPSAGGYITVYPDGESRPTASNLNFTKGQTVANLVTVPVTDGKVILYNGSGGTVELILDLEGYYSGAGQGYKPLNPLRVLDTRNGTGAAGPVPAFTSLTLPIPQLPAGTSAVALNLTVTQPTEGGYLTAYPPGEPVPLASNLNFRRGETVANLAVVPVVDGKVELYNGSRGTTQMVADLQGFYGTSASGATETFVPYGPVRQLDTRNGTGGTYGPVGPHSTTTMYAGFYCDVACPAPKAAVLNVTAVRGTRGGYLTVYPAGQARPLASNVNYTRGAIVPNLVMVGDDSGMVIYNGSSGSVNLVADEEGYFIKP